MSLTQLESESVGQELADLSRQITATMVAELAVGSISDELAAIIEARDRLRARLSHLEGPQHG